MQKLLAAGFFLQTFFIYADLAGASFWNMAEISTLFLAGVIIYGFFIKRKVDFLPQNVLAQLIIGICGVYFALDAANFWIFGDLTLAWQKYRAVMAFFVSAAAAWQLKSFENLWILSACSAALAGAFTAVYTVIYYFGYKNAPLIYLHRFSLRRDYNMYATVLLMGIIAVLALLTINKNSRVTAISILLLPTMMATAMLSGSRRVIIMFPFIIAAVAIFAIATANGRHYRKRISLLAAAIFALTVSEYQILYIGLQTPIENRLVGLYEKAPQIGETDIEQRYNTIGNGSLFEKRKVIYQIAFDEIKKFSARELILGRGGGNNIKMYDAVEKPLDSIYPNRQQRQGALSAHCMLLADFIDGGAVKLMGLTAMLIAIASGCFNLFRKRSACAMFLCLTMAVCVLNSLISNRFGLLYDRYFVVFAAVIAAMCEQVGTNKARGKIDESSCGNGDLGASI